VNRRLIARGAPVRGRRVGPRGAEGSEAGLRAGDRGEGVQEVTGRRASPVEPRHRHHVAGAPMRPASAGLCTKNLLEITTAPSRVPARKSFALVQKAVRYPPTPLGRGSDALIVENAGWRMARRGLEKADQVMRPEEAKARWPSYAADIDAALEEIDRKEGSN
jgi:hypothetical protein